MVKLSELFVPQALKAMRYDGYVRTQTHPTLPLMIYNYTDKAACDGMWNHITLNCRGLIVNEQTGEVVARPFRKFFNHGQTGAPQIDLAAPAVVTDKLDGSMGIIYPTPDGYAVATRGSFTSEQAIHATEVLKTRYPHWAPPPHLTVLVEILYPENRIVVDYGQADDLVLLGGVGIDTGCSYGPSTIAHWPGPRAAVFPYRTLGEALAAPPRPNAEGLVVHFPGTDERIKLKQDDYIALHRIVTGLNARTVWQHLVDGRPLDELIAPLPDELHEWVREIAGDILSQARTQERRLCRIYDGVIGTMPTGWDPSTREGRKVFATAAAPHSDRWALFALLDGHPIAPELLKRARPAPYITPSGRTYSEETA